MSPNRSYRYHIVIDACRELEEFDDSISILKLEKKDFFFNYIILKSYEITMFLVRRCYRHLLADLIDIVTDALRELEEFNDSTLKLEKKDFF